MHDVNAIAELAEFPVVTTLPIQWGDQDAFGHVNNTVPIRWFESSRIDYLQRTGLSMLHPEDGLGPILASVTCHYRRQQLFPDNVHIGARVTRIGRSSLTVTHGVYSETRREIAVEGETVLVVFDYGAQRPVRVPDAIRDAIGQLEGREID